MSEREEVSVLPIPLDGVVYWTTDVLESMFAGFERVDCMKL